MTMELLKRLIANRWVKLAIQLLIILFCALFIYQNIKQIDLKTIRINIGYVLLSLILTMLGTFIGGFSWWVTLRAFRHPLPFVKTRDIQFKSNLAKYLPGYGWQLVGKGYMSVNRGIPSSVIGAAMIFEYAEIFLTGLLISAWFIPSSLTNYFPGIDWLSQYLFPIRIATIFFVIGAPLIYHLVRKTFFQKRNFPGLDLKWVLLLSILMAVTWLINSLGFHLLFYSLGLQVGVKFNLSIFVLTITYLIGLIIIIVPGSIGIREALFIYWLSPFVLSSQAGVIAIIYRVTTILSEVIVFLLNNFWNFSHAKNQEIRKK